MSCAGVGYADTQCSKQNCDFVAVNRLYIERTVSMFCIPMGEIGRIKVINDKDNA